MEELEAVFYMKENRALTFTYETGDKVLTPSHLICWGNTISINQSKEQDTHFESRFVYLSKILVDFRKQRKQWLRDKGPDS